MKQLQRGLHNSILKGEWVWYILENQLMAVKCKPDNNFVIYSYLICNKFVSFWFYRSYIPKEFLPKFMF